MALQMVSTNFTESSCPICGPICNGVSILGCMDDGLEFLLSLIMMEMGCLHLIITLMQLKKMELV